MSNLDFESRLRTLETELRGIGRSYALDEIMRPGLRRGALGDIVSRFGVAPTEELELLYEWRGGANLEGGTPTGDGWLFPGFYQVDSLGFADSWEWLQSVHPDPNRVPVFEDGGGGFIAADLSQGSARGSLSIIEFDQPEPVLAYGSLSSLVSTILEAIRRQVIFSDDDRGLWQDWEAFYELAREMNPDTLAWS